MPCKPQPGHCLPPIGLTSYGSPVRSTQLQRARRNTKHLVPTRKTQPAKLKGELDYLKNKPNEPRRSGNLGPVEIYGCSPRLSDGIGPSSARTVIGMPPLWMGRGTALSRIARWRSADAMHSLRIRKGSSDAKKPGNVGGVHAGVDGLNGPRAGRRGCSNRSPTAPARLRRRTAAESRLRLCGGLLVSRAW